MQPVKSSNIEAIGHVGTTLTVKFKDTATKKGATWSYHNVPAEEFHRLMAAPSIGGHFGERIRNNYKGTKHEAIK